MIINRIHTTYTLPKSYYKKVGIEVPYPGVDWESNQNEFRYHRYYQWVGFVLFFQSTLFYIPRWLWKMWEGGKIQALMMDLDVGVCSDHEKRQKKKLLVDYLYSSRGHHNWYAGRYFFCELLSLANVIFQIYALDKFFDGEFITYGTEVIQFSQMDQGKTFNLKTTTFSIFSKKLPTRKENISIAMNFASIIYLSIVYTIHFQFV